MAQCDICLINPPTTNPLEPQDYFPLALLALGGVFRQHGVRVDVWDLDVHCKKVPRIRVQDLANLVERRVRQVKTNLFGISAICSNLPIAIWLAREIKRLKPEATIIFGGPQPSATPHRLLECFSDIDAVVVGEGEETVAELIRTEFAPARFKDIPGVASRVENQIHYEPRVGFISNLDDLPLPDYSLINMADYELSSHVGYHSIEAGRGCPFACTFCSTSRMWKRRYRMKSPERIMQEMAILEELAGITTFDLIHDNFTTSHKYVEHFCETWKTLGHPDWFWGSSSRVDCLTNDLLETMAEANLRKLFFGIETASPRMQKIIGKRLDLTGFDDVVRRSAQLGVRATTAFILGFPEETPAEINATIELAVHYSSSGAANVFFTKLGAMAGTKIHETFAPRLELDSNETTVSPLPYAIPELHEMIADYPDIFSTFYHIPHPFMSAARLCHIVHFSHGLVDYVSDFAELLFTSSARTPLQLFAAWEQRFKRADHTLQLYEKGLFGRYFQEFLNEVIFPDSLAIHKQTNPSV